MRGAPAGGHAYWLGPVVHGAPVRFANPSAVGQSQGFAVRVRTPTGQDVLLVFRSPRRPSAALIRAARAALRPIPAHVSYTQ